MLVFVAVTAGWMVGCSTTSVHRADNGQTYFIDAAGNFAVLMPKRPQESITVHTNANFQTSLHEFIVDPSPSLELGVMYNDLPESLPYISGIGAPWFFDSVQEGVMKHFGESRLIDARDGKFGSHPMREIRFEALEKKVLYQMRIIAVQHRMYQLIAVSSVGLDVSHEVDAFFNSFSLIHDVPQSH
jgi:hypothetical protein